MGPQPSLSICPQNCEQSTAQQRRQILLMRTQDAAALIKYHTRTSSAIPPHYLRTYRLAAVITVPLAVSILLFWVITHGQPSLVLAWDILPQSFLFLLALLFLLPFQRLSRTGRYRFLSTLKRVSIGGIAEADNGKFGIKWSSKSIAWTVSNCRTTTRRHTLGRCPDIVCKSPG